MVSTLRDVNTGAPALGRVREVNIGDLLGRAEKHLDMTEVEAYFAGKRVLVTGGGGSIGSELCRQIMSFTPLSWYCTTSAKTTFMICFLNFRKNMVR